MSVRDTRLQQFHIAIGYRAQGRCEAGVSPKCRRRFEEAHHVVTRRRGIGWPWLNDPSRNGLGCCSECHDWIHRQHVEWATRLSMLRSRPIHDDDPGPILDRIAEILT